MSNLISKYNISEKDLYSLGVVETQKRNAGYLQKEKLKAAALKILKPYNVKFLDIARLLSEIKEGAFDVKYSESISNDDKLEVQKIILENSNISKFYTEWWSGKTKKQKWIIAISILLVLGLIGQFSETKNNSSSSTNSSRNNNSQSCIGDQGCISKVRENFTNTGKTILGEEYIGNGKFGISFMDSQHPGAFNATVTTDCNCNVTNVNVSTIR